MICWPRLSLFLLVTSSAWAGFQQELVPGLIYFRIADIAKDAADLQTALSKDAVVLDLRSAVGSTVTTAALTEGLEKTPQAPRGLRLILINPSTSNEIIEAVSHPHSRQLTIGPRTPALAPDIAVASSAEDDRRAYDALSSGTPLEKLIVSITDKKRFDEAALVRTRGGAVTSDSEVDDGDDIATGVPTATKENRLPTSPPPVPHDLVLERAVQIFRALNITKTQGW